MSEPKGMEIMTRIIFYSKNQPVNEFDNLEEAYDYSFDESEKIEKVEIVGDGVYTVDEFQLIYSEVCNETEFNVENLERTYYEPSGSYEYYDVKTDTYYNQLGQELRSPEEYDTSSEGYTPFGDE
jgi:hypothetical protein